MDRMESIAGIIQWELHTIAFEECGHIVQNVHICVIGILDLDVNRKGRYAKVRISGWVLMFPPHRACL